VSQKNGASGGKPDVNALRAEIARTRADLGETVQALAAKADVKARAKEQVEHTKAKVKAQATEAGEKLRDAALVASDKVRHAAQQAGTSARGTAAEAGERAQDATGQVRRNPIPLVAVLVGVAAVVGVILIVRGRRR
jgi:cobalamin biosynthesis Mg chelatase CobN